MARLDGGIVALVAGSARGRRIDDAVLGRALDSLPAGSLVINRGRFGVERAAARVAAERGIHVGALRCPPVKGQWALELETLARLSPSVVFAAREGDADTSTIVRLGRAAGAEVHTLGPGQGSTWSHLPQTDASAMEVARRGAERGFICVTGSRDWRDLSVLAEGLRQVRDGALVMGGEARGLDAFAEAMAYWDGHPVIGVGALWDVHDKSAGFMRNEVMAVREPEELRAFPLGGSGTAHMIGMAESHCVPVIEPTRPHRLLAPGKVVHCRGDFEVYVGRGVGPGCSEPGVWGNRYSHLSSSVRGVVRVRTREEAVVRHRRDLILGLGSGGISRASLIALHGKVLGCWCAPKCCHGETLEQASFSAMTEQARGLKDRVAEMVGRA